MQKCKKRRSFEKQTWCKGTGRGDRKLICCFLHSLFSSVFEKRLIFFSIALSEKVPIKYS